MELRLLHFLFALLLQVLSHLLLIPVNRDLAPLLGCPTFKQLSQSPEREPAAGHRPSQVPCPLPALVDSALL